MFLWTLCLLLSSGDIHHNPGPDSVTSNISSSLSENSFENLSNHLSVMHLNFQSIFPKIDVIICEALFSESRLKPEMEDDSILIENFMSPFRTVRVNVQEEELLFMLGIQLIADDAVISKFAV